MDRRKSSYLPSFKVICGVTNPGALLHSVLVDRLKDPAMHSTLAFQDHGWPLIPPLQWVQDVVSHEKQVTSTTYYNLSLSVMAYI